MKYILKPVMALFILGMSVLAFAQDKPVDTKAIDNTAMEKHVQMHENMIKMHQEMIKYNQDAITCLKANKPAKECMEAFKMSVMEYRKNNKMMMNECPMMKEKMMHGKKMMEKKMQEQKTMPENKPAEKSTTY